VGGGTGHEAGGENRAVPVEDGGDFEYLSIIGYWID
jgi:hypothetical protein